MSKGFLVLAQNTPDSNYVTQAYALALSIKNTQLTPTPISLITNDEVPEQYIHAFDKIIPIPFSDSAKRKKWKVQNRWKFFHATPYDETIVLDTDMLVLEDFSKWWEYCANRDVVFCSKILNYKQDYILKDTAHRKTFIANNLTNPYFALHYFKKTDPALEFYNVLEFVVKNWEECYNIFAPLEKQDWLSMDLSAAVAIEILGLQDTVIDSCSPLEFVHMKPGIQGWPSVPSSWQHYANAYFNSKGELLVGSIKQPALFHYVEKDFVTLDLLNRLEEQANGN
jgi:hypothetical protein